MKAAGVVSCLILACMLYQTQSEKTDDEDMANSASKQRLLNSLEKLEQNLPTMDYNDKSGFETYIHNLTQLAMENDTHHKLDGVVYGNRTADDELYNAMHNIRIQPDPKLYPPGFDFFNYSGYVHGAGQRKVTDETGKTQEVVDVKDIIAEVEKEEAEEKARDEAAYKKKEKERRDMEKTIEDSEEEREKAEKKEEERKEREKAMETVDREIREMEKVKVENETVNKEEAKLNKVCDIEDIEKYRLCEKEDTQRAIKEIDKEKKVKSDNEMKVNETLMKTPIDSQDENIIKTNEKNGRNKNEKGNEERKIDKESKDKEVLIKKNQEANGSVLNDLRKYKKVKDKIKEKDHGENQNKDIIEKEDVKEDVRKENLMENEEENKQDIKKEKKDKRKRRQVVLKDVEKEEKTNQILRDMIVDDEYRQQMGELKNKIHDKAHIKNYLYVNFEHKDWYKRYKRELTEAFNELNLNIDDPNLFDRNIISKTVDSEHVRHRSKRDLGDYEKEKDDFTKKLANFEINQANIKNLIDQGIGLNMQKAMKLSIDYAQKAFVNTSSSLDESVQRFFIMKQEYMNLIDKWYHGVVIDLPNYLKSQERKKINLSFDDDQPTPEEREKLNKLNEYERVVDREFAEVGIHYGKTLLNNYCDMDDLFYKYHRENNQVEIKTVFNEVNTKELLAKEKIAA